MSPSIQAARGHPGGDCEGTIPLPAEYRILPCTIPLRIPGFLSYWSPGVATLAPAEIESETWFVRFVDRVESASRARRFLPVIRMSDGEYSLLLGAQRPSRRERGGRRIKRWAGYLLRAAWRRSGYSGFTAPGVSVGRYTHREVLLARRIYAEVLPRIAGEGILAMHLSHGRTPFQEHFHPALQAWLKQHEISLTLENYVPFYFVYALLRGPQRGRVLAGRRILVVQGAVGGKRERIMAALRREGAASVAWCGISTDRSLFDVLDLGPWAGQVDLVLVGGGVGKPNLFRQLERLGVPCLDAGYVFEVWADPDKARDRVVMQPDSSRESDGRPGGRKSLFAAVEGPARVGGDVSCPLEARRC